MMLGIKTGLGLGPSDVCYDQNHPWWLPNIFDDSAESDCLKSVQSAAPGELAADIYSRIEYGTIPGPTLPAAPAAPQTQAEMTTPGAWTPDQAAAPTLPQTAADTQAAIKAAQAAGTYNPSGNLPINASGTVNWAVVAVVAAVAFVVLKVK